jgi:hypothetical protein
MTRWMLASFVVFSFVAKGQVLATIGEIPTKEDCLSYIAILPTFHSEKMSAFYGKNPDASAKELVEKIQSLADAGDQVLRFTYSQLLLNGYCVPKNICAARRYLEKSRNGPRNWEQDYPYPPWPKDADSTCN